MRRIVPLFVLLLSFYLVGGAYAARPDRSPAPSHAQIVSYWTPDRVAHAMPREVSPVDLPTGLDPLARSENKSGGNGGKPGGSTSSGAVTGAHWTGGGTVAATTGKVLFTLTDGDYVCSGAVVQENNASISIVLTAGHCVYDETNHKFATNWMFVPDYEDGGSIVTNSDGSHSFSCDTVPYGCWTADSLVTTTAWADGNQTLAAFNDDYGFAVMGPGGKTGQSLQLDATAEANPIAFNQVHPTTVFAFGYPHAAPYDGQSLTYCSGTDERDTWGGTTDFGLNCGMTGGSSGGPWLVDFDSSTGVGTLNSVNSFKYTFGPKSKDMFGPYFDAYTEKTFKAALTAGADTVVSPPSP